MCPAEVQERKLLVFIEPSCVYVLSRLGGLVCTGCSFSTGSFRFGRCYMFDAQNVGTHVY